MNHEKRECNPVQTSHTGVPTTMDELQYDEVEFSCKQAKKAFSKLDGSTKESLLNNLRMIAWNIPTELETAQLKHHVGRKAFELKINGSPAKRCVYVVVGNGKVVVLHAFEKTCNGVDRPNMEVAKGRYKLWEQRSKRAA